MKERESWQITMIFCFGRKRERERERARERKGKWSLWAEWDLIALSHNITSQANGMMPPGIQGA